MREGPLECDLLFAEPPPEGPLRAMREGPLDCGLPFAEPPPDGPLRAMREGPLDCGFALEEPRADPADARLEGPPDGLLAVIRLDGPPLEDDLEDDLDEGLLWELPFLASL